jgi:hypothetical protein
MTQLTFLEVGTQNGETHIHGCSALGVTEVWSFWIICHPPTSMCAIDQFPSSCDVMTRVCMLLGLH